MTTHRALTFTIVLVLAVMGALLRAQSGYDLFQKALATERADGNLRDAIQLYERVVKESASDRRLVAQALLRIAECHEKLGQRDAVNVYQRIVRDFSDQAESAAVARTRLAAGRPTLDGPIGVVKRQVLPEHLNSVVDYLGAVSADGQYVSFVEWPSGDLAVYDFGSKTHRKLTNECTRSCAEYSVFSKDSKRIAYGWWDWKESRNELRVANVTGDPAPRTLVDIEEVENIEPHDWSPDGQWIAVSSRRKDRSAQIGLVRVKDGALSTLKSVGWLNLGRIRFSPDGKYVAFDAVVSDTSDQRDVFVLAVDGSREIPAVTHPGQDVLLGWSPDGMHLLFASDRRGSTDLWALPIASGKPNGEPMLVARDIPSAASLGITHSGAVYVEVNIVDTDISTAAFDFNAERFVGEPATPVQQWVGSNWQPDWSPDGKYLAYLSFRTVAASQRNIIVIRSLETGQVRELTPMLDKFFSPRWSPDSRSFVVMGWNAKGRGVFRIDAETGEVSLLVSEQPGELIGTAVEWSSDGKSVFYSRNSPGSADRMFVRRDLASGRDLELVRPAQLGGLNLSPDGRYIVTGIVDPSATNLNTHLLIPTNGGEPRRLVVFTGGCTAGNTAGNVCAYLMWAPDSQSFFLRRISTNAKDELWRVSLDGSARKLDVELPSRLGSAFRVHPDGKRIVYTVNRPSKTEIWVIENFLPALKASK